MTVDNHATFLFDQNGGPPFIISLPRGTFLPSFHLGTKRSGDFKTDYNPDAGWELVPEFDRLSSPVNLESR